MSQSLSLLSPPALAKRPHRALLLQFILAELFEAHRAFLTKQAWEMILSTHPRLFPFDWAAEVGFLNRMKEHASLLKSSFPDHRALVLAFDKKMESVFSSWEKKKTVSEKQFNKTLHTLYSALEPLVEVCKENENLIYFLLKNRQAIDALKSAGYLHSFLLRHHPSGLEELGEKMCDRYHQRGFFAPISELKLLITELASHARPHS